VSFEQVSYGHDIEFSWLLCEAAEALGDPSRIEKAHRIALEIADTVAREGVDGDGALFNEGDAQGKILDDDKDWWPQAEAAVGFLNAWRISGEPRFYRLSEQAWLFAMKNLSDAKGAGGWRGRVDRKGRRSLITGESASGSAPITTHGPAWRSPTSLMKDKWSGERGAQATRELSADSAASPSLPASFEAVGGRGRNRSGVPRSSSGASTGSSIW
jgi:hypothetical protein